MGASTPLGCDRHGTLLASGGIAAAEHVPKTIILGADAVFIDIPLLIALECTVCGHCENGQECLRHIETIEPTWGATRIVNLMLCWRDQILEVLGAMGIRDVRRLRGEKGRAIFADQAKADFLRRLQVPAGGIPPVGAAPANAAELAPSAALDAPSRFATQLARVRVEIDRNRCTNCGLCAKICPVNNIKIDKQRPVWLHHCEQCLKCLQWCPGEAIQYGRKTVNWKRYRNPSINMMDICSRPG